MTKSSDNHPIFHQNHPIVSDNAWEVELGAGIVLPRLWFRGKVGKTNSNGHPFWPERSGKKGRRYERSKHET